MTPLRSITAAVTLISLIVLAGCSTTSRTRGGGYYKDDGPGAHPPSNIDAIPDAVPRIENHARANTKPYVVFGVRYVPLSDTRPFRQEGTASWYGRKFHGAKTANGETYDMYGMTAAHPTLPIPSYARVTSVSHGKSVIVRVNDRGPFHSKRIMDLSYVAAAKLGIIGPGSGQVVVEAITNDDIRRGNFQTAKASTPVAAPAARRVSSPEPIQPDPVSQPVPNALAAIQTSSSMSLADTSLANNEPEEPDASRPSSLPSARSSPALLAFSDAPARSINAVTNGVYLQFGAFSGPENANHLARQLNQKIAQVESRPAQVQPANNLYKVQIGPYPSRTEAVNAALRIQQETGVQPTVAVR